MGCLQLPFCIQRAKQATLVACAGEGLEHLRAAMQGALEGPSSSGGPRQQQTSQGQRSGNGGKQGLASAFAAALGGAAAVAGAGGLEEGRVEVAGDAELEEQERALLGLSEDELLARLGEGGVGKSAGNSVGSGSGAVEGDDDDDGWGTPPPAGFAEAARRAGLAGGRAGLFQEEDEGEWVEVEEGEEGEWFEAGEGEGEEQEGQEGEGEGTDEVAGLEELGADEAALLELSEEQLMELVKDGEEGLPKVPSLNDLPDA